MAERGRPKKEKSQTDSNCVFAVQNQVGKMKDMIGNQKHCMIIQNAVFESAIGVPEKDNSGYFIDQELWDRNGYEDVIKVPKHECAGCAFFKDIKEYVLIPSNLKVRYAWEVRKRND